MNIDDYCNQIRQDEKRNSDLLHLTANEPYMSNTARSFLSSRLGDRYYFGGGDEDGVVDFQPSTYLGLQGVQNLVTRATDAAKDMLGAVEVNLSCLSGVHAMTCAILATTNPGDTVMTVGLDHGGHFSTKPIVERMGRSHVFSSYDFDSASFDVAKLSSVYHASNAKAFYIDASFYLGAHNLREIREALGDDAIIIYDASHTIGLIMGGQFQNPFKEGADVICANTHKTLPGPQKGMIAFRDQEFGTKANDIINGGLYSSPHTATVIALAIAILEMESFGEAYAQQIIKNSNALADSLAGYGYDLRKASSGRYSENHQVHLLTEKLGGYRELYQKFLQNNMSVNFSDTLGNGMFMRIGTQEITRRGMKENEMKVIAEIIHKTIGGVDCRDESLSLAAKFQHAHYSFDDMKEVA